MKSSEPVESASAIIDARIRELDRGGNCHTCTQAVTPVKRDAQARIAKLILADVPAAKPVTPTIQ